MKIIFAEETLWSFYDSYFGTRRLREHVEISRKSRYVLTRADRVLFQSHAIEGEKKFKSANVTAISGQDVELNCDRHSETDHFTNVKTSYRTTFCFLRNVGKLFNPILRREL